MPSVCEFEYPNFRMYSSILSARVLYKSPSASDFLGVLKILDSLIVIFEAIFTGFGSGSCNKIPPLSPHISLGIDDHHLGPAAVSWAFEATSQEAQTIGLCGNFIWTIYGTEAEAEVVFSAVVFAATLDAGGFLEQRFNTGQHGRALGAGVKKLPRDFAALEGKFVTPRLIWDAEIGASLSPLQSMCLYAAATGAVLGEKVREFVTQGSLNFGCRNFYKLRVQQNRSLAKHGHARSGAQSGIPINAGMKIPTTNRLEKLIRKILQKGILTQSGIAPRLFNIVGLQADSTHDGAPKIKKQLPVFHAARAG